MISQVNVLLAFFIAGAAIGIVFDIFRIARKSFKTPDFITYIQDILFWILAGIILLFTIFTFTTGEIRLYMIVFLIFGAFIYFICISKFFIKINTKIITFCKFFIRILLKPGLILIEFIKKLVKKAKNLKNFSKSSGK